MGNCATSWHGYLNVWPRRIELTPSRYPHWLRAAAALITWAALALSGLPAGLAALAGVAASGYLYRWWPATARVISVEPDRLLLILAGARQVVVEAPFRAIVRPGWLALHCPGQGWVWLFADQASATTLIPLRQVLWLRS